MLRGLAVLLVFQLAGEVLTRAVGLPVPGPVAGMVLLLVVLEVRGPTDDVRVASSGLLSHLSVLFVPAGVGIMLHAPRLAAQWPAIVVALLVSTTATIAVTGWLVQRLSRAQDRRQEARP